MLTLLENEELRAKIGEDLRGTVIERHNLESLTSKIFDVIREVAKKY